MVSNSPGDHRHQEQRLRSRLLLCRVLVCTLLILIAFIYTAQLTFNSQSSWVIFTQPLLAAACLAFAVIDNDLRLLPPVAKTPVTDKADDEKSPRPEWLQTVMAPVERWLNHLYPLLITLVFTGVALYLAAQNFTLSDTLLPIESERLLVVTLLLIACFGLLVCERMLSFRPIRYWPWHKAHLGLLRVLLSLCLLVTAALGVSAFGLWLSAWVLSLARLILILVALEFILRTLFVMFTAPERHLTPPFLTQSLLAEQYHWPLHPLRFLRRKIAQHFGVDVANIQAFRLMGKILLPVIAAMTVVGWLISGLNEISLHQRGVYERFGRPVAVLSPGLHVGLPWPFGRVQMVDYGAVHELKLSEKSPIDDATQPVNVDSIEGPAPQESWRLWDNSHVTDQAQVIASAQGDKQSFQIVNMDIRVIWRVGMRDIDAINSLYQTDDIATTIQRISRQVLTQYFAHQQLDALLNEQRATMATHLNQAIQARLNQLHLGVELLYTRVESIHPPAGAANAYHGVQAAQIAANALIARERGYAATQTNDAQKNATTAIDAAQASAYELQTEAANALTRYNADYDAWKINPDAWISERRYQAYSNALSKTPLLILDSQIAGHNNTMLDLRQFSSASQ